MKKQFEAMSEERIKNILAGTKFDSIEDAIAADLASAVPIFGAVSDFLRVLDSDTKPQKALQILDFATEPVPILSLITPTNTLLYLDSKGLLPVKLNEAEKFFDKFSPKR